MPRDLYVMAVGDNAGQLDKISSYFTSPVMKVIGVNPKYVAVSTMDDFKKAIQQEQTFQGLLLLSGDLNNGINLTSVSFHNNKRETALEVMVLSTNPSVVSEAEENGYVVLKGDFRLALKKLLYDYRRLG